MSDATKAMQQLNGLEIAGQPMRVQIASVSSADVGMAGLGELDEEDGEKLRLVLPQYISDTICSMWNPIYLKLSCTYNWQGRISKVFISENMTVSLWWK